MDPAGALPEPPQGLMVPALTLNRGRSTVSTVNSVRGPLLVGVMPGQNQAVLNTAIDLARALDTTIEFVYVDPAGFRVREPDGGERFASIDPDNEDDDSLSVQLESLISVGLAESGIGWSYRMENLLTGSVAAHLAHHQSTPVLVVPAAATRTRGGH